MRALDLALPVAVKILVLVVLLVNGCSSGDGGSTPATVPPAVTPPPTAGSTLRLIPVVTGLNNPLYIHSGGRCAIIGGDVYRGALLPALVGVYLYADLCSGEIFGLTPGAQGVWQSTLLLRSGLMPLSFGHDVQHELYLGSTSGTVFQFGAGS